MMFVHLLLMAVIDFGKAGLMEPCHAGCLIEENEIWKRSGFFRRPSHEAVLPWPTAGGIMPPENPIGPAGRELAPRIALAC